MSGYPRRPTVDELRAAGLPVPPATPHRGDGAREQHGHADAADAGLPRAPGQQGPHVTPAREQRMREQAAVPAVRGHWAGSFELRHATDQFRSVCARLGRSQREATRLAAVDLVLEVIAVLERATEVGEQLTPRRRALPTEEELRARLAAFADEREARRRRAAGTPRAGSADLP